MPEVTDVHVDSILTNLSIQYKPEELIWSQVMPQVKVAKRSNKYFVYDKATAFRLPDDKIGPKSYANVVEPSISTDNYSVKDHSLEDWVSQAEIDEADPPYDPMVDATEFLTLQLHLAQEKRVADIVFDGANYASTNKVTLSGTSQWGEAADDPIGDIMKGLDACIMRPNTIVFGGLVWSKFRALPEVLDAVKGATRQQSSPGGLATIREIGDLFEVQNVLVGRALYNTAKKGQTASYNRLWGKNVALLYVDPNPNIRSITWGVTFSEMLFTTYRGFDQRAGVKGSHFVKISWNSDEKIIAADTGYLIINAIA